jgi:hypothetical protein
MIREFVAASRAFQEFLVTDRALSSQDFRQLQSVVCRFHVIFGFSFFERLSFLAHGLLSQYQHCRSRKNAASERSCRSRLPSRLRRYFQPRNVALGMKPLENLQAASLILLAAVFLSGVGRRDGERRRFIPASFDFGVHERQKYLVVIVRNWRADDVELERLRVLNREARV